MRIEVLVFGGVAELVGADRVVVEVGEGTVRAVLKGLREQWPALRGVVPEEGGRLAVNHVFAHGDHPVRAGEPGKGGGDEVALVALVGGG